MADPAFTLVTKRNPSVRVLADLRDERGTMEALGTHTYPASVLYSSRTWIDANRDDSRTSRARDAANAAVDAHAPATGDRRQDAEAVSRRG